MLVGNKLDEYKEIKVEEEKIKEFLKKYPKISHFKVSVKLKGENIEEAF